MASTITQPSLALLQNFHATQARGTALYNAIAAAIVDIEALQAQDSTGTYTCLAGDAVGDVVYISAANTVALADANDAAKRPAIGIIISKPTTTSAVVQFFGEVTGLVGLTAGAAYYLSETAGDLTATPPAGNVQLLGYAKSTTILHLIPAPIAFLLSSTAASLGGNLIGYEDAGNKTTAATVDAALDEIYAHLVNGGGVIELKPSDFYLKTGAPLAIFAGGASAVPGMAFVDSKALGIRWNDNATHDAVATSFQVPPDADITANFGLRIRASKTGATLADAATFTVEAFNQVDSALHDADTDFGGTSGAMTGDAAAKTIQSVSLTLALANLAAYPASVTMTIKPTNGTLANADDLVLHGAYILYTKKLTS